MTKHPTPTRRNSATGRKKTDPVDISLWEKKICEEQTERERFRLETLARTSGRLANYFKNKKVRRVFLVGSILHDRRFFSFSDIDILVEGLRENYFKTLTEVGTLLERPVDLIEKERCPFSMELEIRGRRIL